MIITFTYKTISHSGPHQPLQWGIFWILIITCQLYNYSYGTFKGLWSKERKYMSSRLQSNL
uniref:Uncharacterized protein n=1 Tax=Anguilla anguilla TaxID=7936 RepID=A0A0E9W326_ANGAN